MFEMTETLRLRLLLDRFSLIEDDRECWRVTYPLPEVLLLVVCGTIAAGDDFEDIVDWGEDNLAFLRRFLPYHHGAPGARWLRMLMNRVDQGLFADCFRCWAAALRPDAPDLVAIDGKTSRGSHNRNKGRAALHLVSAFAMRERLVIGQEAVAEGGCEQDTIPLLLERLAAAKALDGALVTVDAIACNPKVAKAIIDAGADYLIAVKANQPSLMVEAETFEKGNATRSRRFYVSSRAMTAAQAATTIRAHWAIETSLHWVLDVKRHAPHQPRGEC